MNADKKDQAKSLANEILDFVNSFGCDETTFAETICTAHRTLQQSTMHLFMTVICRMAENTIDPRNEEAVRLAKKIAAISDEYTLPLI